MLILQHGPECIEENIFYAKAAYGNIQFLVVLMISEIWANKKINVIAY